MYDSVFKVIYSNELRNEYSTPTISDIMINSNAIRAGHNWKEKCVSTAVSAALPSHMSVSGRHTHAKEAPWPNRIMAARFCQGRRAGGDKPGSQHIAALRSSWLLNGMWWQSVLHRLAVELVAES
jgi:hypothetical protein